MADQQTQVTAAYSGRDEVYEPSDAFKKDAHVASMQEYEEMWQRSVDDPETFWREQADRIETREMHDRKRYWITPDGVDFEVQGDEPSGGKEGGGGLLRR